VALLCPLSTFKPSRKYKKNLAGNAVEGGKGIEETDNNNLK